MTFEQGSHAWPRVMVTQGLDTTEPWVDRLACSLCPVEVEVVPTASASGVMQRLGRVRPGVVVVDQSSLMDMGWSLLRQIRRAHRDVPCLMVLRRVEPALLSKALQLSAYSVFEPPVDVDLMGRMVWRLLNGRQC